LSAQAGQHDPAAIFDALARHRVDYLTIGGLAVGFWANPRATKDTDIVVPDADTQNDARLGEALRELRAESLALEAPGARALGIRWELEANLERWQTVGGILDVMRDVEGARPYAQMRQRAERTSLFGAPTVIVGREDLIAMKLAAARGQDVVDLEALLDPRNVEAQRVAQRALDRELLRTDQEPNELGDPVDPCEHEVDAVRRALAPVGARSFNNALARRARELREIPAERLAELARQPLTTVPQDVEQIAASAAGAARRIESAEEQEFALLRDRERAPWSQRSERRQIDTRLHQATGRVEQLQGAAEQSVDRLREEIARIEDWYREHGESAVQVIAARRECYRRDRWHAAGRIQAAPEDPPDYVAQVLGARPPDAAARERWDEAARCVEAYVSQYQGACEPTLAPPDQRDRAARGAWERMQRAARAAGFELPAQHRGRDLGPGVER
jgi:hypothetical protein